jgi:lipoyl(octanoyl) transferase
MAREGWLVAPEGLAPYDEVNRTMHELADARLRGEIPDTLLLLEHPPVYTAGRSSRPEHMRASLEAVRSRGAEIREVDRGGSFTFHGPGQLVGYPIVDVGRRPDAIVYVRRLEEVVMRAGAQLGVTLERSCVQTGVWAGDRKVCAIGIRLKRMRVALHGFALNCTTDLSWFDAIIPCGLADSGVTSLSKLAGRDVRVDEVRPLVIHAFEEVFDLELRAVAASRALSPSTLGV